jgi:hypothetical protein
VLPEYAVDLYFAYTAAHNRDYVAYAAANMTGSNRLLLLGLGWSLVGLAIARRRTGKSVREVTLESSYRAELGFLAIASVVALVIPATGRIPLLLGFFGFYLWKVSRGEVEQPHLVGPATTIGGLPKRIHRFLVAGLFLLAAAVILACAGPFAHARIGTGTQLGIDQFLLVQWFAPLASEAPEFVVAILFAVRGNGAAAIGTLISSKVSSAASPSPISSAVAQPRCTWMPARSRNSCSPRPKPCSASQRCSRCGSPAVDPARPVRGAVRPPCPARRRGTPLWHLHRDRRPDPDPQPTAHPAHSHRPVAAVAVDADNQPTARETEHRHRRTLEAVT